MTWRNEIGIRRDGWCYTWFSQNCRWDGYGLRQVSCCFRWRNFTCSQPWDFSCEGLCYAPVAFISKGCSSNLKFGRFSLFLFAFIGRSCWFGFQFLNHLSLTSGNIINRWPRRSDVGIIRCWQIINRKPDVIGSRRIGWHIMQSNIYVKGEKGLKSGERRWKLVNILLDRWTRSLGWGAGNKLVRGDRKDDKFFERHCGKTWKPPGNLKTSRKTSLKNH